MPRDGNSRSRPSALGIGSHGCTNTFALPRTLPHSASPFECVSTVGKKLFFDGTTGTLNTNFCTGNRGRRAFLTTLLVIISCVLRDSNFKYLWLWCMNSKVECVMQMYGDSYYFFCCFVLRSASIVSPIKEWERNCENIPVFRQTVTDMYVMHGIRFCCF